MKTADFLVERLKAWGVRRIFGYSGDGKGDGGGGGIGSRVARDIASQQNSSSSIETGGEGFGG